MRERNPVRDNGFRGYARTAVGSAVTEPSGLAGGNTGTLGTFVRYACEQGLIKRRPAAEELFAAETREKYVI